MIGINVSIEDIMIHFNDHGIMTEPFHDLDFVWRQARYLFQRLYMLAHSASPLGSYNRLRDSVWGDHDNNLDNNLQYLIDDCISEYDMICDALTSLVLDYSIAKKLYNTDTYTTLTGGGTQIHLKFDSDATKMYENVSRCYLLIAPPKEDSGSNYVRYMWNDLCHFDWPYELLDMNTKVLDTLNTMRSEYNDKDQLQLLTTSGKANYLRQYMMNAETLYLLHSPSHAKDIATWNHSLSRMQALLNRLLADHQIKWIESMVINSDPWKKYIELNGYDLSDVSYIPDEPRTTDIDITGTKGMLTTLYPYGNIPPIPIGRP